MEAARRIVDRLLPDDLVGLYTYPGGGTSGELTTGHAAVRKGLDRIMGMLEPPPTVYNLRKSEITDISSGDADALTRVAARHHPYPFFAMATHSPPAWRWPPVLRAERSSACRPATVTRPSREFFARTAHYLLSVEVMPGDRDGAAHAVRVRVNKRGLTVRSRATVVVPRATRVY